LTEDSQPEPQEEDENPRYYQQVFNHFLGPTVFSGDSRVGINNARYKSSSRRGTGKVSSTELQAAKHNYTPPAQHGDARDALRANHLIVLYGRGTGRRTGAINLLAGAPAGPLETLSSVDSLDQLTTRKYRKGHGYLLSNQLADEGQSETTDFTMTKLAERLETVGAYMVITSPGPLSNPRSPALSQFFWQRPSDADVLIAHGVDAELAAQAVERITPAHSLGDVVQLAKQLHSGMDLDAALAGLDLAEAEWVTSWFDDNERTDAEILEAVALLFLEGMPEQRFEQHLRVLIDSFPEIAPETDEQPERRPRGLLAGRRARRDTGSLITVQRLQSNMGMEVPGPPRRCLVFRSPGYRKYVAATLSERFDDAFWGPVFAWIHRTMQIADPETRMQVAKGLALLAAHDYFDAVREEFLQPWSEGAFGQRAWVSAPHVLWWMCLDDEAAAMALRTAIRWSRSGVPKRRQAASRAFAGEVGIKYPTDATTHLWLLIEGEADPQRAQTTPQPAQTALANLYSILVELTPGDATGIVSDLIRRYEHHPKAGSEELSLLLRTTLIVLSAPEQNGYGPALRRHLLARPAVATDFAHLCAIAMINRPVRVATFALLYNVLSTIGATHEPLLHSIFRALAKKLPLHERRLFKKDFERYVARRKAGNETGRLVVAILLKIFSTFPYQEHA
jgi:hypothetical protein